jgi:hypothetical protein
MLDETMARQWCADLASRLPMQDIRPHDVPYLTRYFCAGWSPFHKQGSGAVFLHHFVASDPNGAVHSHPWAWGCSLILVGGYTEHRCTQAGRHSVRTYTPGDVNVLQPGDRHRIDLLGADCWTLFLAGPYAQAWGFFPTCEAE